MSASRLRKEVGMTRSSPRPIPVQVTTVMKQLLVPLMAQPGCNPWASTEGRDGKFNTLTVTGGISHVTKEVFGCQMSCVKITTTPQLRLSATDVLNRKTNPQDNRTLRPKPFKIQYELLVSVLRVDAMHPLNTIQEQSEIKQKEL